MNKVSEYTVISAESPEMLAESVSEAISIGGVPLGGIAVSSRIGGDVFYQAVSKIGESNSKIENPKTKFQNSNSKISKSKRKTKRKGGKPNPPQPRKLAP